MHMEARVAPSSPQFHSELWKTPHPGPVVPRFAVVDARPSDPGATRHVAVTSVSECSA